MSPGATIGDLANKEQLKNIEYSMKTRTWNLKVMHLNTSSKAQNTRNSDKGTFEFRT